MNGNRHDSHMLRESQLIIQLQELMPQDDGVIYSLYGDPAYPQSIYLFGGYDFAVPGTPQAFWNTNMSKVREVVEWGFKKIRTEWSFLDFRASMKIFKVPVGSYYTVGAFLCNLRSLFYDNQTAKYFEMDTYDLEQYLSLID